MVPRKIGILECLVPVILTSCECAANHDGVRNDTFGHDQMKDDLLGWEDTSP